jgi:hypothetical protein
MSEADVYDRLLRRAAERAVAQPFFLASALQTYADAERLDDTQLAGRLGCSVAALTALRLCRRPADQTFAADVQRIAERFAVDSLQLAELLRMVDALDLLERVPPSESTTTSVPEGGFLAAARDEDESDRDGDPPCSTGDAPR